MKLENQVVSLELAKKLKELGMEQESIFVWTNWEDEPYKLVTYDLVYPINKATSYSAYTVAELGEMLPDNFEFQFFVGNSGMGSLWHLTGCKSDLSLEGMAEKTEADARAKMLIYLVENQLITL